METLSAARRYGEVLEFGKRLIEANKEKNKYIPGSWTVTELEKVTKDLHLAKDFKVAFVGPFRKGEVTFDLAKEMRNANKNRSSAERKRMPKVRTSRNSR